MGLPSLLLPVTIDSTNKWIDLWIYMYGYFSASMTEGTYSDMIAVCAELQTVIRALHASFSATTVTINSSGHVVIATNAPNPDGVFAIYWASGSHSSANCGSLLGYDTSSDDTGETSYTSDYQHMHGWYPERALYRYGPWRAEHVGSDKPRITLSTKNVKVLTIGWRSKYSVEIVAAAAYNMLASEAAGSYKNMDLETVYKTMAEGQYGRWREDRDAPDSVDDVYLLTPRIFDIQRTYTDVERYSLNMEFVKKES